MNGVSGINPAVSATQMTTATGGSHIVPQTLRAVAETPVRFFGRLASLADFGIGANIDIRA